MDKDSHDSPYWTKYLQMGFHGSGERLTKKQTASRPDYLWPEIWKDVGSVEAKRKQMWAIEKPKLDIAGKLRGIYFIDPADEEFKEIMKTAQRKLDVPIPAAMLCKIRGREYKETCGTLDAHKTKYASFKPTNLRDSVWVKIMKTTLQGKESTH